MLVLWTGLDAAGDTWEQLNNLTNCCEAMIMMITGAFEQATVHLLALPGSKPSLLGC